jgi:hypothetical protein
MERMTVGELIELLSEQPSDAYLNAEVVSEGQYGFDIRFRQPGQTLSLGDDEPVILALSDAAGNPLPL